MFKNPFSRFIFTSLILLQWIQICFALRGDSACKHSICVSATLEGDTVTYEMTSLAKSIGWMALGFGPHMHHTHSVIMWRNQDGTTTLSQRYAGYLTFDLTKEFVLPTPQTLTRPKSTANELNRVEKVIVLHAFCVSLGFLVLLPAGSLIARWGRSFTPKWFNAHRVSNMVLALPVITLGVLLGPVIVYIKPTFQIHLANAHEVCGVILLFLYYAQVVLGHYIHEQRNKLAEIGPITRPHPPLNVLHICFGVSIIGLSFFQVRSGLQWWETLTGRPPTTPWAYPLWHVWIVMLSRIVLKSGQMSEDIFLKYIVHFKQLRSLDSAFRCSFHERF